MTPSRLKEIEQAQLANGRQFEKLDQKKRRLATFEQDLGLLYSDLTQPLERLQVQASSYQEIVELESLLLSWKKVEERLADTFLEAEGRLKKEERTLEEQADQLARAKKAYYDEEENHGN